MQAQQQFRLGIDIGGTFTDLSLVSVGHAGGSFSHKVSSTPSAPSRAVARGITELLGKIGQAPSSIKSFIHGTTIALNAVIERRGSPVALFVSQGNRDILEIARLNKPDLFNLRAALPAPLVPRRNVFELERRGGFEAPGAVVDNDLAEQILSDLPSDIESVAICFLNSHADAASEQRLAKFIGARRGGMHVSCSAELWPEIREYERATVAVLNAYVQPIMSRYVDNLECDTAAVGVTNRLYITQSNGGVMSADTARTKPVNTMLSGPASGVVGAAYIARLSGITNAVTLDIGGTSADVSIIRDGEPIHSTEAWVGDFPVIMPAVDVFAVGAGGGSIAWFDELGLLKLGPKSAGADPGPACYGRGGTSATTTDAYLVSGFINPDNFVGGTMRLSVERAKAAIAAVAGRLGTSAEAAASSILEIASATMVGAILPMMTKRGIDPKDLTLIAFGGAGPTHACLLADEIMVEQILIPPSPGTMCALGAAIADFKADYIRSHRRLLSETDIGTVRGLFRSLELEADAWLTNEKPDLESTKIRRGADLRYKGQAFNIEISLPELETVDALQIGDIERLFHQTYEELYRNSDRSAAVELINLRVQILGQSPKPRPATIAKAAPGELPCFVSTRSIHYAGTTFNAEVFERASLKAGQSVLGPAIIEQFDTTTVVAPGFVARVDAAANLILTRTGDA